MITNSYSGITMCHVLYYVKLFTFIISLNPLINFVKWVLTDLGTVDSGSQKSAGSKVTYLVTEYAVTQIQFSYFKTCSSDYCTV